MHAMLFRVGRSKGNKARIKGGGGVYTYEVEKSPFHPSIIITQPCMHTIIMRHAYPPIHQFHHAIAQSLPTQLSRRPNPHQQDCPLMHAILQQSLLKHELTNSMYHD